MHMYFLVFWKIDMDIVKKKKGKNYYSAFKEFSKI